MMKLLLVSLMTATAAAFSVVPATKTSSSTALFYYNYQTHSQFDVTGPQGIEMTENQGVALVQGGSDVGYALTEWPECDVDDPTCYYYIEPECDVMGDQGCLVNMEPIGQYKVQGGATVDWSMVY